MIELSRTKPGLVHVHSLSCCSCMSKRPRASEPHLVPPDFNVPETYTRGRLSLTKLCGKLLHSDYAAVMGSASKLTRVFAPADDWPSASMTRSEDLVDLQRHEAEFDQRLAFAYTVIPTTQSRSDLPTTLGCIYINPATRKGFAAEVVLWAISHGMSAAEATALDAEVESLARDWLKDAWPFRQAVVFPGRGDMPWPTFEALPWRDEAVPRIGADAKTLVMYNARACGLARV